MDRMLVDLRNEWAVQSLVLFSFTLQVFLLLFASIRRYNVQIIPRFLLWLAYQLADSTALFTLGHMAISSRTHEEQPLMAFWAPFLLVHLGGQDTITAYSFEDNRLWLRHLETLVVQVLASSYVIYKYMPGSETLMKVAAVLIFVVGILKYGERIWALQSASFDSIWNSFDRSDASVRESESNKILSDVLQRRYSLDKETVLMGAHGLLDVCVGLFIGLERRKRDYVREIMRAFNECDLLDKLMEMELSLMYDILYTKATVIHAWYGCCTRVITLVATVTAFLMFLLSSKHGHSRKDIAVTYVLSVGALLLEAASAVKALGSTWTCANLHNSKWHWLHGEVLSFRRSLGAATTRNRRWSGSVCQYNLLQSCAHDAPRVPRMARLLGRAPGQIAEKWCDELYYSWPTKLSNSTKELVLKEILLMGERGEKIGSQKPGLLTLNRNLGGWPGSPGPGSAPTLEGYVGWSIHDIGFEDSIMAWHLASDICLFGDRSDKADLQQAIKVLSNYMMFLLVLRPHMLPGPVRRSRYDKFHEDLHKFMASISDPSANSPQDRIEWCLRKGFHARINSDVPRAYFDAGVRLADVLYDRPNRLDVIFGVWVEMLCYVSNHCSRESHARQLSMGGELVTVVWLMARHANLSFIV